MRTLRDLLLRLAESGIEFVIIGGYAGVMHGSTFVTRDLDICAVLTSDNVERLRLVLADLNPRHRLTAGKLSFLQVPPKGEAVTNLYLDTDWGTIDILTDVFGLGSLDRLRANAESFSLEGRVFRVLALEDLIQAKEALGREKDLLIAKELRTIAEKRRRSPS